MLIIRSLYLDMYICGMILSAQTIKYFKSLSSQVNKGITSAQSTVPYMLKHDPVIRNYEFIHDVWFCSRTVSNTQNRKKRKQ
ncbi:hypothetical protein ES705_29343 [subsurface metagenome]